MINQFDRILFYYLVFPIAVNHSRIFVNFFVLNSDPEIGLRFNAVANVI